MCLRSRGIMMLPAATVAVCGFLHCLQRLDSEFSYLYLQQVYVWVH